MSEKEREKEEKKTQKKLEFYISAVGDSEQTKYEKLDDAVKAYLESNKDFKQIGFSLRGLDIEVADLASFSDNMNHIRKPEVVSRLFRDAIDATDEEIGNILENLERLREPLMKDNVEIQKHLDQIEHEYQMINGKRIYQEINEDRAKIAHKMKYYYPYIEGTKTNDYKKEVDEAYSIADQIKKIRPEAARQAYRLVNEYSMKLAENINQSIEIDCMCPSDMIAGAKNISAEMRKQQDTARMKNQQEYRKIKRIKKRLDNILTGKEKIQTKTTSAIKESAEKLTEEKESTKQQQQSVEEKNQEQPQQTIEKSGIKQNNKYFKAVENIELEKLQLMFTGKPNEKMRDILKDNHFHWSWENRAWERALTDEAMKGANTVATKFEELEKQGKLEFEKLESSKPPYMQNKKFHGRKFEERDYDYTSLEKQLTLSRDRKYQEKIQGDLEPKLDQSQDKLHQEQLEMVEDVNMEIEIGE